jgi:hypothetical protein
MRLQAFKRSLRVSLKIRPFSEGSWVEGIAHSVADPMQVARLEQHVLK